jgi:biopolymer transport protein ExbD
VTTPLIGTTAGLSLPPVKNGAERKEQPGGMTIRLLASGALEMRGERFASPTELSIRLSSELDSTGATEVVRLEADRSLRYGEVAAVLAACRAAGVSRVALIAESPPGFHSFSRTTLKP